MANDDLQPLISTTFASNHLFQISIVQRMPAPNLNKPDLKDKIFGFVTLAPGEGDGQNRTYNFQNRITQKFQTREIEGLSIVLRQLGIGNNRILPYTKFTRSQQGQKMLSIWTVTKTQTIGQQQVNVVSINLTIQSNNTKHTFSMTMEQAYSLGSVIHEIFKKAINKEFEIQLQQPKQTKPSNVPTPNANFNPLPNNSISPVTPQINNAVNDFQDMF